MRIPITIHVPGIAAPGGSKKAFPIFGPGRVWKTNVLTDASGAKGKDWRARVAIFAKQAMMGDPLFDSALRVTFSFTVRRPAGHLNAKGNLKPSARPHPTTKPDVLKLARAVEDALTGIVWVDDALIVTEIIRKRYGTEPGVTIYVEEEDNEQAF